MQGRSKTLEGYISCIPEVILESTSWLLFWMGICRLPFDPVESRNYLEKAFLLFKDESEPAGLFLSVSGIIEAYVFEWNDFNPMQKWIAELEEIINRYPDFPSAEIEIRVVYSMFCALMFSQPQHPRMFYWAERLRALIQQIYAIDQRIMCGNYLFLYYSWIGDNARAQLLLNDLKVLVDHTHITPIAIISYRLMECIFSWLTASHEACMKAVTSGLETAHTSGVHILSSVLLSQGIFSSLSSGDYTTAKEYLGKMDSMIDKNRRCDTSHYHHLAGWEAFLRKDLPLALEHAEMSLRLTVEAGWPFTIALNHIAMAQVLFECGKHRGATIHVSKAQRLGREMKSHMIDFKCLIARSYFAIERDKEKEGLDYLRKAMSLGREKGYVNTDWFNPSVITKLCMKALEAGIEVEYVCDLIQKRDLIPESPPLHIENWPWTIKIYTLGRFSLLRDGKQVRSSGKAQKKPLEMLKALIAFGGREVSEGQITDTLWPEADGDASYSAFATTLQRLRKLIGYNDAILFQDGRLTLDPCHCWVDVWTFERLLGEAEKALDLTKKAMSLYKGHFLSGDNEHSWSFSLREKLRSKFFRSVMKLGQSCENEKEWKKAVDCYQKGLEVDDLAEEFHQRLMVCYHNLGNRARAIEVYRRCQKTLSANFDIEPSLETQTIYNSLK